uniref:Uncharacterized protein n=1 Tax=Pyramimonas obovata TaxID=1411642 RepID=A0A7S0R8R0_9CHLO|mmetsp:Transcript_28146/g.61637  ORF Transcript_28146/g.61637 Transcript_28146/m.61637 type:complete len:228 (+) Transcript_28146:272-955(+)
MGLFGIEEEDQDPDPMVIKWFREKLHNLPGFDDTLWQDAKHVPAFARFVFSYHASKVYGYLEGEGTNKVLVVTYNPNDIDMEANNIQDVLYFVRDPGYLTPETLPHLVSCGRCKPRVKGPGFLKAMSDLQILMNRREDGAYKTLRQRRQPLRPQLARPRTSPQFPRSGSLMPCFLAQSCTLPSLARPASPTSTMRSSLRSSASMRSTGDLRHSMRSLETQASSKFLF